MPPLRRSDLARYAAPLVFLAAMTVIILLIRAGIGSGDQAAETTPSIPTVSTPRSTATTIGAATTTRAATTTAATTTAATSTEAAQFYTVQSGDTLGGIAIQFNTTVQKLLELNPGIDPRALHSGQRVRVG